MSNRLEILSKEVMPFGKWKDKRFEDIPVGYFWWMLDQEWLRPVMREKIDAYLKLSEERRREQNAIQHHPEQ